MRHLEKKALLESLSPEMLAHMKAVGTNIGVGGLFHVASNAAIKYLRSGKSQTGNMLTKSLGELGVKHGLDGKTVNPWAMDRVKQVFGPELMAEYMGSRNIVKKLRKGNMPLVGREGAAVSPMLESYLKDKSRVDKGINYLNSPAGGNKTVYDVGRALGEKEYKRRLGISPKTNINDYPVLGGVGKATDSLVANKGHLTQHPGIRGKIVNTFTNVLDKWKVNEDYLANMSPVKRKAYNALRVGSNIGANAVGLMTPGLAPLGDHMVVNSLRQAATMSPSVGKKWVERRIMGGLHGETDSKVKRALGDYLYSPTAWGEAQDFGAKAKKDGFNRRSIKSVIGLTHDFM